ncbi:MAG: 50S ribosomal protein L10 [Clostridia bacterium]|nr:50S ribosomal protein L10 [Oscillospiraceae bacterium]MDY5627953.1 50S ribosomal protein L10 [Clostridia bacterium]
MPSAKVLESKKQIVADMIEKLKTAQAGVLVDYCGLTVEEDTDLRNKLRAAGVEYKVVKNTLTRFAAKEVGFDELDAVLNGPTSLAVSYDDPVAPAKVIADFAKDNEKLEIKSGFLDGKVISLEEINQLAKTPSKDVLIAKIMGSLNSPISALTRTLQAIVDNGVELSEIEAPKKEEAAEETAPAENEAPAASEAAPAEEAPAAE